MEFTYSDHIRMFKTACKWRLEGEKQPLNYFVDIPVPLGLHDNFFELGGHSLLATRLVSMIRKEFEVGITIKDIFQYSTVEKSALYIDFVINKLVFEEDVDIIDLS